MYHEMLTQKKKKDSYIVSYKKENVDMNYSSNPQHVIIPYYVNIIYTILKYQEHILLRQFFSYVTHSEYRLFHALV